VRAQEAPPLPRPDTVEQPPQRAPTSEPPQEGETAEGEPCADGSDDVPMPDDGNSGVDSGDDESDSDGDDVPLSWIRDAMTLPSPAREVAPPAVAQPAVAQPAVAQPAVAQPAVSLFPTPGVGPMSGALPQPSVRPASTQKLGPLRGREAVPREVVPREVAPREVVPPLNGVTPAAGPFDSMLASGDTGSCSDTFGLGVTVGDDLVASCVDDGLFDAVNGDGGLDGNLSHADGGSPGSGARRSGRQGVSVDRFQE
jgi:hypothetical protein